jgi:Tfp pilus assembly protein PilF
MGIVALLALGLATVILVWSGGLVTDADKARLPVERGSPTLQDLDHAIELNPDYLEAYVRRARLRLQSDDFAGAGQDVDQALRLSPANPDLLTLRAKIHKATPTTQPASTRP